MTEINYCPYCGKKLPRLYDAEYLKKKAKSRQLWDAIERGGINVLKNSSLHHVTAEDIEGGKLDPIETRHAEMRRIQEIRDILKNIEAGKKKIVQKAPPLVEDLINPQVHFEEEKNESKKC